MEVNIPGRFPRFGQFMKRILILLVPALVIKIFSLSPSLVEQYYSTGIYPHIASFQRILFGWIPFSVGDIFYAVVVVWLITQVIRLIKVIKRKQANRQYFILAGQRIIKVVLIVYISFNFLWGLNYNRYGIDHQMKLDKLNYTDTDLVNVTELLAAKLNVLQSLSVEKRNKLDNKKNLFNGAIHSYKLLSGNNSVIKYNFPSVKPSIYSYLGNYLGFTGYYNPFSGEAQVNTTVPVFIQPFTTCHEIGHQLGYAKESEANFAGFLAASSSDDPAFLYSVYFDMYAYAARYLYLADSNALKQISGTLSPAVKNDIKELRIFYRKYSTPIETAIDKLYAEYLKANEQPTGKMSYNEVIALLIAYHKKYKRI
jgi:hypothetical protein